jgi:hypothetical protein
MASMKCAGTSDAAMERDGMKKKRLVLAAFALAVALAPAGAVACRFSRPPPPMIPEPYDALVVATAPADIAPPPGASGQRSMAFRVVETLDGSVRGTTIQIRQELPPLPDANGDVIIIVGGCIPPAADTIWPGQAMRAGQRVLAVVRRDQGVDRAISWTPLDAAMRAEPFVARYLGTTDPAQRRRLAAQWREARRRPGPVPLSDPARWLAPAWGSLVPVPADYGAAVVFDVLDDGGIDNCNIIWSSVSAARDQAICPMLAARNRFAPPLRSSERRGVYEVRWTGP